MTTTTGPGTKGLDTKVLDKTIYVDVSKMGSLDDYRLLGSESPYGCPVREIFADVIRSGKPFAKPIKVKSKRDPKRARN